MLNVLDIFSGIGGFSLGLERTGGFRTAAFCEIDPFCRRVLAKHWPDVPCYEDVRELTAARLAADGIAVDVIAGGFPCQDVSVAGRRAGLEGARSGLWSEYRRLIGELRPRFVIVENVPGLLGLGMGTVLGDLSALRYDAVWDCIPASAIGAHHRRDRVWVVAHTHGRRRASLHNGHAEPDDAGAPGPAAHAVGDQLRQQPRRGDGARWSSAPQPGEHGAPRAVADAASSRCPRGLCQAGTQQHRDEPGNGSAAVANTDELIASEGRQQRGGQFVRPCGDTQTDIGREPASHWLSEPAVGRLAHGLPNRVAQLRALGNAVVPQIPEMIGRAILQVA